MSRSLWRSLVACAALAGAVAPALALDEVRMMSFGGATNLPVWIAQDKGLFEKQGIKLTFATTNGSVEQISAFYAGKFDVISTAFDNIVAYAEGQSDIPLPGPYDMVAFLGVHMGLNSLMVPKGIAGYADIKGKTVAVDALKSGYGIVLYQILQMRGGLTLDKDYKAISVGNTDHRLAAMRDGRAVAAIVGAPQDMDAEREGFKTLAEAAEAVGAYQGSALVGRRGWLDSHPREVSGFIHAMAAATDMIFADKKTALDVLTAHAKGLSEADAEKLYARLIGPGGFNPHARISTPGVETVLKIRETYGEPKKPMGPMSRYVDTNLYDKAMAEK